MRWENFRKLSNIKICFFGRKLTLDKKIFKKKKIHFSISRQVRRLLMNSKSLFRIEIEEPVLNQSICLGLVNFKWHVSHAMQPGTGIQIQHKDILPIWCSQDRYWHNGLPHSGCWLLTDSPRQNWESVNYDLNVCSLNMSGEFCVWNRYILLINSMLQKAV